ncbi:MAG: ATP-binding cassette domain-containing protein [Oceanospirillaceae bacterium]|nr:ATP-binding cassette domain-containing protein [Oceanospirillaceae bacterium]
MLFTLKNSCFSYHHQQVLKDISLSIAAGENVALVGASGVGKSTLLNLLAQQHPLDIAYCTQTRDLVAGLNSYNNIYLAKLAEFGAFKNLLNLLRPNPAELLQISVIAAQLQIEEKLFDTVNKLSGGQQQRVAVARAFYQQRAIFIGDEPVSNLDSVKACAVIEAILERHDTNIIALHDRGLALRYFDRIIGLKQGEIVLDAPASEVSAQALEQLYL